MQWSRLRRALVRWVLIPLSVLIGLILLAASSTAIYLASGALGSPSPAARSTGHDALWLGHAWVDGRRTQSDVDALVARLRGTGIRDLLVHTGPFSDDGTLDAGLRPQAQTLIDALHAELPGIRVQAWLGAHPTEKHLHLWEPATRARMLDSISSVLDDGFDGIHYDLEPVFDGDENFAALLRESRPVVAARGALLSVAIAHQEPYPGFRAAASALPADLNLWTAGYLYEVALLVDQVAIMSYDTALPTETLYCGYVRRTSARALATVPTDVALLIGVPAYPPENGMVHPAAENLATAIRGVRLAVGDEMTEREFGIAIYVDFTATDEDWATYHRDWAGSA